MVRSGEIGKLVDVEVQLGRTLLLWNHPHSVDLFLYFAGDVNVSRVQGRCTFREAPQNDLFIDDDPIVEEASVEFDTGVTGHLSSKSGINVILTGTSGVLRVGDDGRWLEIKKGNAFAKRVETNVSMSGTVRAFSELETAVRRGNAISIQPHEIEVGMAILLSIAKSALRDGDPVSPNMIEDNFSITGRFGDNYA
jgi:predicted dehydrogenase